MLLPSLVKQLRETVTAREAFRARLAGAGGWSARQVDAAVPMRAEPASLAAVPALLEGRTEGTRRCPHCRTDGGGAPHLFDW